MIESPGGDFAEIESFARHVTEHVESVPDHPEAYEERAQVLAQAAALAREAHCEIAFGMFAESSAGKSLLVGTLLGDPLLLPVAARTVTCNVSVLRLHPTEVPVARITAVRIEYLDPDALDGYAGHLRDVTAARVEEAGGDAAAVRALAPRWSSLPALRGLLVESARELPPNARHDLSTEVEEMLAAEQALRAAGFAPGDVEELADPDRLPEVVDHGEPDMTPSPLAARRSMVRRVVADVDVPITLWSSTLLHGAAVQLVDVPGSGSGRRPIRDDHLRLQELDAVDTALFFLESRPGSLQDSRALQDLMSRGRRSPAEIRDCVLVVAGKFDRLEQAPDILLVEPAVPPEETAVLDRAPTLRDLVAAARDLLPPARDDRIFFVSPVTTLALAHELDLGRRADDVATALGARQAVDDAVRRIASWRTVGEIPGHLGRAITGFTTDGGLGGLRAAMARHAAEHGVDLRLRKLRGEAERLGHATEQLDRRRAALGPVVIADADVTRLFETVLGEIAERTVALRGAVAAELTDPEVTIVGERSPAHLVRDDVERAVYDWPEWKLLFDAVTDGLIVAAHPDGGDPDWDFGDAPDVPAHARDFTASYEAACRDVGGRVPDRVLDRAERLLRAATLVAADGHAVIDGVGVAAHPLRDRIAAEPGGRNLLRALDLVLDLRPTIAKVDERLRGLAPPSAAVVARSFPLDPTRALPWHPDSPRRRAPDYSGTAQALRLRREMTTAVTSHVLGVLADALAVAAGVLRMELTNINRALTLAHQDSARWIATVTEARAATSTGEEPLR